MMDAVRRKPLSLSEVKVPMCHRRADTRTRLPPSTVLLKSPPNGKRLPRNPVSNIAKRAGFSLHPKIRPMRRRITAPGNQHRIKTETAPPILTLEAPLHSSPGTCSEISGIAAERDLGKGGLETPRYVATNENFTASVRLGPAA